MNRVRVDVPDVRGESLVGEVSTTGEVGRFFSGTPFRAHYGRSIEEVPAHVRTIPVLAHVCPVAWAAGADVAVDRVDARFLAALREVRSTFLEMYPEFMTGGAVDCPNPVREGPEPGEFDGAGALFTGGVDSTATWVRHRQADPTLITVKGWAIGTDQDDLWEETRSYVDSFARERGLDTAFVEANMLSFLAAPLLQAHFQRYLEGAWYSSVGHGLGLLGLCAPLAYAEGMGTLYIAATHTEAWSRPWGSRPEIDDRVRWSGTRGAHDGYELSRQEKIDRIGEYAAEVGPIQLRTCNKEGDASNCNHCEKCYRTILGLLLSGLDPDDFGYAADDETLDRIRRNFEAGEWYLSTQKAYHWEVLQAAARDRGLDGHPGDDEFLEWFLDRDFQSDVRSAERSLQHRALQGIARRTPTPVYSRLYPVYSALTKTPH